MNKEEMETELHNIEMELQEENPLESITGNPMMLRVILKEGIEQMHKRSPLDWEGMLKVAIVTRLSITEWLMAALTEAAQPKEPKWRKEMREAIRLKKLEKIIKTLDKVHEEGK